MNKWITFETKPITIGAASRGFLVKKDKIFLRANYDYVVRIIPKQFCPPDILKELEEEKSG